MAKYLDNSGLARVWDKVKSHVSGQPFVRYDSQSLSDAYKLQARTNIDAAKSDAHTNRNLLDNAYFVGGGSQLGDGIFPINQRGLTSYGAGQTIDRWKLSSGGTLVFTNDGILIDGLFFQKKVIDFTVGETYTLSRQTTDGNVVSVTGVVPSNEGWMIGDQTFGVYFRPSTKVCDIQIWGTYHLKAVKLEKGTVSTLANDPVPDFGEELAKCKRRLRYVPLKRSPVILDGGYSVAVVTLTGIEMASFPTASLITAGTAYAYNPLTSATPTSASVIAFDYNTPTIQLGLNAALNGIGVVYDTVIQLSCEL